MKLKDSRTVEPDLNSSVLEDGDFMARDLAARVLGVLKDSRAVNALIAALDDAEDRIRTCAGASLAHIGDRTRDPAFLLDTLKNRDYRHGELPVPSAIMALGKVQVERGDRHAR